MRCTKAGWFLVDLRSFFPSKVLANAPHHYMCSETGYFAADLYNAFLFSREWSPTLQMHRGRACYRRPIQIFFSLRECYSLEWVHMYRAFQSTPIQRFGFPLVSAPYHCRCTGIGYFIAFLYTLRECSSPLWVHPGRVVHRLPIQSFFFAWSWMLLTIKGAPGQGIW